MPKIKPSVSVHLKQLVSEFGDNVFSTDGSILYCKLCETKVAAERRFTVTQHIGREKHVRALQRVSSKAATQRLLPSVASTSGKSSQFSKELCDVFVSANIPLFKLNNPKLRGFLEKHTNQEIPDESTLRKNYLPQCYEETLNKIRCGTRGKKIWVSIDESSDAMGRYIANVVIGTLEVHRPGEIFLLTTEVLEKTNYSTISKLFDSAMFLLWPEGIKHDDVLLFLTDAAPYMVRAANSLKALYSKMVHVTCLAHGLHRVCEEVRALYPSVDRLVANVKKIFLKAPSRVARFKAEAPDIALPPQPIITRWGTWLNACMYYCENFKIIKQIVQSFDSEEAASIKIAQDMLSEPNIEGSLAFIKSNFALLTATITSLEKMGEEMVDSISLIKRVETSLSNTRGEIATGIASKLKKGLDKNTGYKTLCKISDILSGENYSMDGIEEDLTANELPHFKYAPITSVDVERSFSRYKNLLADNRRSFTFDNLRMTFVVQCNSD